MFDEDAHIAKHQIEAGSCTTIQEVMARFEDFMNASYGPEFIEEELGLPLVDWVGPISAETYSAALSLHPDVTIPGELRALYTLHGTPNIDDGLIIYPAEKVLVSLGPVRSARWEDAFNYAPIVFKYAKIIDETYVLVGLLDFEVRTVFLLLHRDGSGFATMVIDDDEIFPDEKKSLARKTDPHTRLSLLDGVIVLVNEFIDFRTRISYDEFYAANPDVYYDPEMD